MREHLYFFLRNSSNLSCSFGGNDVPIQTVLWGSSLERTIKCVYSTGSNIRSCPRRWLSSQSIIMVNGTFWDESNSCPSCIIRQCSVGKGHMIKVDLVGSSIWITPYSMTSISDDSPWLTMFQLMVLVGNNIFPTKSQMETHDLGSTSWPATSQQVTLGLYSAHIYDRLQLNWKYGLLISRLDLMTSYQGLRVGASCLIYEYFYKFKKLMKIIDRKILMLSFQKTLLLRSTVSLF